MNRRDFLQQTALAAAALAQDPRAHSVPSAASHPPRPRSFELEEWTISQLQAAMDTGRFSAHDLVRRYRRRIEAIDRSGPSLNSVIELNPDADAIARELDRERKARGPRGPLHGIPVLIKDNIDTHDRMTTTAGSLALAGSIPSRDAFLVQRLRQAGAVILGKTNLSEWANFRSSRSTSGWSGRGGLTRHPYVLDRNPSGSSSGSAVAVAASLCAVAVGTETDGSIVSPSSINGVVGVKPTLGLVSRSGIIPIAHSQDTAGPMARTVTDAAILLGVLAGADPNDPATDARPDQAPTDYTQYLDPNGLKGARLGVARKFFDLHPAAGKVMEAALSALKELGATLVDPADLPTHGKFGDVEMEVLLYEFKADLNRYLTGLPSGIPIRSLRDVIEFNQRNGRCEMPYFGQETMLQAQEKGPLTEPAYQQALATCRRLSRDEGIDAILGQHKLDALIAPTMGPAAVTDLFYGDRDLGGSSEPAAVAGYPSITVPAAFVEGLPVGLSFFGRAFSEPTLLKLAYAFEKEVQARRPPEFLTMLPPETA